MPENPYASPQTAPIAPPLGSPPADAVQAAPCPNCGNVYARKIEFTWWGGLIGSKIINHVECPACGARFNGKTGQDNTGAIAIYMVVVGLLSFALLFLVFRSF